MEPIRIEIAVKAENGQQGNGNAHGAERCGKVKA